MTIIERAAKVIQEQPQISNSKLAEKLDVDFSNLSRVLNKWGMSRYQRRVSDAKAWVSKQTSWFTMREIHRETGLSESKVKKLFSAHPRYCSEAEKKNNITRRYFDNLKGEPDFDRLANLLGQTTESARNRAYRLGFTNKRRSLRGVLDRFDDGFFETQREIAEVTGFDEGGVSRFLKRNESYRRLIKNK